MRIGYGRVSTRDQNPDSQHQALSAAGCERIFVDHASGKLASRPELDKALMVIRDDDELVVTKLDRLGRSLEPADAGNGKRPRHGQAGRAGSTGGPWPHKEHARPSRAYARRFRLCGTVYRYQASALLTALR